jgi:hypothetical protein
MYDLDWIDSWKMSVLQLTLISSNQLVAISVEVASIGTLGQQKTGQWR